MGLEQGVYLIEIGILSLLVLPLYLAYRRARLGYLRASLTAIRDEHILLYRIKNSDKLGIETFMVLDVLVEFLCHFAEKVTLLHLGMMCICAKREASGQSRLPDDMRFGSRISDPEARTHFEAVESRIFRTVMKHVAPMGINRAVYFMLVRFYGARSKDEVTEKFIMQLRKSAQAEQNVCMYRCAA